MISARHFLRLAKKRENQGWIWSSTEQERKWRLMPLSIAITTSLWMENLHTYTQEELEEKVPKEYHGEIGVFMKKDKLPPQ
jgi:hypothetical protein